MKIHVKDSDAIFRSSVQISNGLKETSADGACLAFDRKYGIMFCSYMPGRQGAYGESRNSVRLAYFPATQPTNIRYVDIAEGHDEYCNNILGLGDGKVRVFYEKDSMADRDHTVCFKDFDFLTETLTEEKTMRFRDGDQESVYNLSTLFAYLDAHGYHNHSYLATEQLIIGGSTFFHGEDGYSYGAAVSYLSEIILFRSKDNLETVEPFAVFPHSVQYEFDYKFVDGQIYAIFRTDRKENSLSFTTSNDMGKTWTEPVALNESINCRPRMMPYNGGLLMAYNYLYTEAKPSKILNNRRTAIRLCMVNPKNPNQSETIAELYNKREIVNISIANIFGDIYLAYSTSEAPLEYINYFGPEIPVIHGKDAIRYVKLGDFAEI